MDGSKETSGDEVEAASTQVQGPSTIKVLELVATKVQEFTTIEILGPTTIKVQKDQVVGNNMGGVNDLPNAPFQTVLVNFKFDQLDFNSFRY